MKYLLIVLTLAVLMAGCYEEKGLIEEYQATTTLAPETTLGATTTTQVATPTTQPTSSSTTTLIVDGDCTDSDGGKEYNVKGTTVGPDGWNNDLETISTFEDSCYSNRVMEYFCAPMGGVLAAQKESYTCPNGCEEGACI